MRNRTGDFPEATPANSSLQKDACGPALRLSSSLHICPVAHTCIQRLYTHTYTHTQARPWACAHTLIEAHTQTHTHVHAHVLLQRKAKTERKKPRERAKGKRETGINWLIQSRKQGGTHLHADCKTIPLISLILSSVFWTPPA